MSKDDPKFRSPSEIAEQASEESDPERIAKLAEELIRALDYKSMKRMEQEKTGSKQAA